MSALKINDGGWLQMKVAIIGAGLAGLSCAHELKKHGIMPDIFEKKDYVGSISTHMVSALKPFDRTQSDAAALLSSKYGLRLDPAHRLTEIIIKTSREESSAEGNLGHTFLRGMEPGSLDNQLASQVSLPITFDKNAVLEDLKRKYDFVVAAPGDGSLAKQLGVWTTLLNAYVLTATMIGNFKTGSLKLWSNTGYARNCCAYLVPRSEKEAKLVLVAENSTRSDIEYFWKKFLIDEELNYVINETMSYEYNLGSVSSLQKENIYLAGGGAGLTDDFLGFGMFNRIESGILAARAIALDMDYTGLMEPVLSRIKKSNLLRETAMDASSNDFDRLVVLFGLSPIRKLICGNPEARAKKYVLAPRFHSNSKQNS